MDYKHEYGRYKKKYEEQVKQIAQLQEDAEGWKQLLNANTAIIAAIVHSAGGELSLSQEAVNRAVKDELPLESSYDEERGVHLLRVKPK